jgi:hypothetical protein
MLERRIKRRNLNGSVAEWEFLFNGQLIPNDHKYCPACASLKEKHLFSKMGNACKECANDRAKKHRLKRRKDVNYIAEFNNKVLENGRENKRKAIEYLGGKCADCGGIFPPCVYDFHHLDIAEKEYNPSALLNGSRNFEKAKAELNKCILLCSNCHRTRHHDHTENDRNN